MVDYLTRPLASALHPPPMATAAPARAARRRLPKWVPIVGWSVLGVLAVTFGIVLLTITFGAVHGVEFSPQTFERRSYSFYELPLLGIQVTATRHEDLTGAAEGYLTMKKHVTPAAAAKQEWHIILGSRGTKLQRKGDAGILIRYLDATDAEEDLRWVKWSEEHPKLADVLWPAVQRLASRELYVFVPDLFDLAKQHDDPAVLQPAIDRLAADKLLFLARRLTEQESHAAALEALDEAAALDPENKEIVRARQTAAVAARAGAADQKADDK
jgi:hypothetical protein